MANKMTDVIMTQMFFDIEVYKKFVTECRAFGINCPIIPGLMCINAYPGFKKMAKFCKTRVPQTLEDKMDSIQDDSAAVKAFGVEFGAEVCQGLMDFGVSVLHFYTLNLEKVVYGITDALKISHNLVEMSDEKDVRERALYLKTRNLDYHGLSPTLCVRFHDTYPHLRARKHPSCKMVPETKLVWRLWTK